MKARLQLAIALWLLFRVVNNDLIRYRHIVIVIVISLDQGLSKGVVERVVLFADLMGFGKIIFCALIDFC